LPDRQVDAGGSGMAVDELQANIACSFCRKPPDAVARLVAGPGVFICNECVALCTELIATPPQKSARDEVGSWEQSMSDDDVLQHLPRVATAGTQVERHLTGWVRQR